MESKSNKWIPISEGLPASGCHERVKYFVTTEMQTIDGTAHRLPLEEPAPPERSTDES
jgi:hypothetical protein